MPYNIQPADTYKHWKNVSISAMIWLDAPDKNIAGVIKTVIIPCGDAVTSIYVWQGPLSWLDVVSARISKNDRPESFRQITNVGVTEALARLVDGGNLISKRENKTNLLELGKAMEGITRDTVNLMLYKKYRYGIVHHL